MSTTKIVFKFVSFTMIMEVYKFTLDDNNACVSEGGNQSTDMKPTRQICHHIGYHHQITVVRGMSVVAWLPNQMTTVTYNVTMKKQAIITSTIYICNICTHVFVHELRCSLE